MANKDLIFTILGIDKASPAFKDVARAADDAGDRLDKLGKFGTKALASFPVAALAAGVATAGALTLVGAGVAATAAVILHNNDRVSTAASDLWADLRNEAQTAAGSMTDDLVNALNTVHGAVRGLAPQFQELFEAGGPAVEHLTNGVVLLARNAMPGFVTALKASEPALLGMESFLESTGVGLNRFFTNMSKGAESSGQIMASTGRIARDALGFMGSMLAELSNSGAPAVGNLEEFLRKLEDTLLSLSHGAFPALSASASGFLAVGSGILTILSALSPILGPIIGNVAAFAAVLKLVDMVSFGQVSTGFAGVKNAIGAAEGAAGKFKAGLGALNSSGLLPLGVVAAGLSVILMGLGEEQQRAAKNAAAHESRIQSLTGALKESNGAIDGNVRALAAKALSEQEVGRSGKSVLEVARESGVSLGTLTDAYLGNADAQKVVSGTLTGFISAHAEGADVMDEAADRAFTLRDEVLPGLNGEYSTSAQRARDLAAATGQTSAALLNLTPAQKEAKQQAEQLKGKFEILKDAMKSVAEKGQAVIDVLDKMSGKQPDLREATQAWNDLMRTLTKDTDWNTAVDGVQKLGNGLVDAKGEINTTTEAGSRLQDWVQSAQTDFANTAAAMQAAGVPADEMNRKLGTMRQQFIDNAVAQGLPRDAAIRLADAYHLVPGEVSTLVLTPNLAQKMQEMGLFASQVRTLPNGSIVVTADTNPANGMIQKLIQDNTGRVIRLSVTASGVVSNLSGGGMKFQAKGGWVNGPGGPTSDSVPTMLSNKEFVVNAEDAADYGPMLEAINAGRRPIMSGSGGGKRADTQAVASTANVTKHYHLTVYNARNSMTDLREQFRQLELMA